MSSFVIGSTTVTFVDDAKGFRASQAGPLLQLEVPLYVTSAVLWSELVSLRSWSVTPTPIPGGANLFVDIGGGAGVGTLTLDGFPGSPLPAVLVHLDRPGALPGGGRSGKTTFWILPGATTPAVGFPTYHINASATNMALFVLVDSGLGLVAVPPGATHWAIDVTGSSSPPNSIGLAPSVLIRVYQYDGLGLAGSYITDWVYSDVGILAISGVPTHLTLSGLVPNLVGGPGRYVAVGAMEGYYLNPIQFGCSYSGTLSFS